MDSLTMDHVHLDQVQRDMDHLNTQPLIPKGAIPDAGKGMASEEHWLYERDTPAKAAEDAIDYREKDVFARELLVTERETKMHSAQHLVANRETDVSFREESVKERESAIETSEGIVEGREGDVSPRETLVGERELKLDVAEEHVANREHCVAKHEAANQAAQDALGEHEQALSTLEAALKDREQKIGGREVAIVQIESAVQAEQASLELLHANLSTFEDDLIIRELDLIDNERSFKNACETNQAGLELAIQKQERDLSARSMVISETEYKQQQLATQQAELMANLEKREEAITAGETALISRKEEQETSVKDQTAALIRRKDHLAARESAFETVNDTVSKHQTAKERRLQQLEDSLTERENDLVLVGKQGQEIYETRRAEYFADMKKLRAAQFNVTSREDAATIREHHQNVLARQHAKKETFLNEQEKKLVALQAGINSDWDLLGKQKAEQKRELGVSLGEMKSRTDVLKEREEVQQRLENSLEKRFHEQKVMVQKMKDELRVRESAVGVRELDQEIFFKRGVEQQAGMDERERILDERDVAATRKARVLDRREEALIAREDLESDGFAVIMTPEGSEDGEDWGAEDEELASDDVVGQ